MSAERTAVTGAAGHLGRALLEHLGTVPVRAIDTVERPAWAAPSVEWVVGDVLDEGGMRAALDGIDVVHHLASLGSVSSRTSTAAWKVNVRGARVVADAALAVGVGRMVHCSSARAFDATATSRSIDERTPRARGAATVYDRSKAAGEASVRRRMAQGLDLVVVHPSALLGPHLPPGSLVGDVVARLAAGTLATVVQGAADWVDARDVAASVAAAATLGRTGESYLLGGHFLTLPELAVAVAAEAGVPPPRRCLPSWVAGCLAAVGGATTSIVHPDLTPDAVRSLVEARPVNSGKARAELGHRARPLVDTLRDTIGALAGTVVRRSSSVPGTVSPPTG